MSRARVEEECSRKLSGVGLLRTSVSPEVWQRNRGWPEGTLSWTFLVLTTLLVTCGVLGCRTLRRLPPVDLSEAGWNVRRGQTVWRSKAGAPEIAGELLVASRTDGRVFLQFVKTPLPFVVAQIAADAWQIEFIVENKVFSGPGRPPSQLGWLQLARCLAGNAPGSKWRWQKLEDSRWRLENKISGEMLEGFLAP